MSGEKHHMFGKKHGEESIAKMKETLKKKYPNGRPVWNKGLPMLGATKKKVSDSKKNGFQKGHLLYGKPFQKGHNPWIKGKKAY